MAHPLRIATLVSALALHAGWAGAQEADPCVLGEGGNLPFECRQGNPQSKPGGAIARNVPIAAPAPGDLGFSIRIGAPVAADQDVAAVGQQAVGRLLERMGVGIQASVLGAQPKLNVVATNLQDTVAPGTAVTFQAASNYPYWIARAEIVVMNRQNTVIDVLPVEPNGTVDWTASGQGAVRYRLDVYDAQGRKDSTKPRILYINNAPAQSALTSDSLAAVLAEDRTEQRRIPVRGGAVVVAGTATEGDRDITIMGETIAVREGETFAIERILPPGGHGVVVQAADATGMDTLTESIDIPKADGFATGLVDVTFGDGFSTGRIAAYGERSMADGARVVVRIDTEERDLDRLFDGLTEKDPRRALLGINPMEPFLTYGDDSQRRDLAPSSGQLFLEWTKRSNRVTWGDIQTDATNRGFAQENRTLYGLQGEWNSLARTEEGAARVRTSAFAAAADSAAQTDVLKATGGSVYFLSRRDLLEGSVRVRVETRDSLTGQTLASETLSEGTGYRVNGLQGVLSLARAPELGNSGNTETWIVVDYTYVPVGPLDGTVAGGRVEGWITDNLRIGLEGRADQSTTPTTSVVSGDVLFAPTPNSQILIEQARSKGPGTTESVSENGGLTGNNTPVGGPGGAQALRITAETSLQDWGLGEGSLSGFYLREDQGFVGPDGTADTERERARIAGDIPLNARNQLSFGARMDRRQGGLTEQDAWIAIQTQLGSGRSLSYGIEHEERSDPTGTTRQLGSRTNLTARLDVERDEATRWWTYAQATVAHSGGAGRDDRVGAGVSTRVGGDMAVDSDLSYGTLGWAWGLGISQTDARGTRRLAYTLDPDRRLDQEGFSGSDKGVFVASADTIYSDTLRATTEARYDAFGSRPSSQMRYGLTWSRAQGTTYELGVLTGQTVSEAGDTVRKQGLTAGMRRTTEQGLTYGLRGEWIRDRSDDPTNPDGNVDTFALVGDLEARMSDDWRLVGGIDGLWSDSPITGVGTGRYVEGNLGFAYRPADNDKTIGLVSYTFLHDEPAQGQRNYDGTLDGDGQRSHILNAAISHRFDPEWTVAAKYGLRHRTLLPADGSNGSGSWTQLGALRLDYHLNSTWDVSGEVRGMWHDTGSHETGALVTVHRAINDTVRVGLGYAWGGVSDDLRTVEPAKEGLFLNLTASF
jgi:hypothetical protein